MKLSKSQRGTWSLMACILLFTFLFSACGSANNSTTNSSTPTASSGSAGKNCKKIGVSFPETNTSYRWDNQDKPLLINSLKNTLYIPDSDILYNNANGSATTQQTQVESMLTQGACILVVAPVDSKVASAIVDKAKSKNVPVVSYDRLIANKDVTAYVSFRGQDIGKLQGDYIAKHYQQYVKDNGTTNTVIINGAQTDNNAILFKQGLHTSLDPLFNNNTLKNVYEQFTDWTGPVAQKDMQAALSRTGNKVAIAYVANDNMANSVIAALKTVHLDKKVLVTGQDAAQVAITNILNGEQAMTVYKPYWQEARDAASIVAAISKGDDIKTITTDTSTEPTSGATIPSILEDPISVDITNVKDTIIKDNFYTKDQVCKGVPAGAGGIC